MTTHQVEEIEEYLTRIMFINHGKIVLDIPVADIAGRFSKLSVSPAKLEEAKRLRPMHSYRSGDNHVLIYDGLTADNLAALGTASAPNLAELFVATVKGGIKHG